MKACRSGYMGILYFTLALTLSSLGYTQGAMARGTLQPAQLEALEGRALREELASTLKANHKHPLDYRQARAVVIGKLYLEQDTNGYHVRCVYCQKDFSSGQVSGIGPGQTPDANVMNVEHTWPQSKFEGPEKGTMKTDLHHLFPSDSQINSQRGNIRFGEVQGRESHIKCQASHLGDGPDGRPQFEPPTTHKGNVARAIFYFATRYNLHVDPLQEKYLRNWNQQDPVDESERTRNDQIEEIQGNRNPFVDHPEWIDRISDF